MKKNKFLDLGDNPPKKKKISKKNKKVTHYMMILDKSGSMHAVRGVAVDGFNENVQTIKRLNGEFEDQDFLISLIYFNDKIEVALWKEKIDKLEEINVDGYAPGGMTAMCDAVGHNVMKIKEELKKEMSDNEEVKVVVTIFTDGYDNSSKEYDKSSVAKIIAELQDDTDQWTFSYIGVNHDVQKIASQLNIPASNTIAYKGLADTQGAFAKQTEGLAKYATMRSVGKSVKCKLYNDEEEVTEDV